MTFPTPPQASDLDTLLIDSLVFHSKRLSERKTTIGIYNRYLYAVVRENGRVST